ncbi:GGDEF domain-containing protein [Sulfuricurvum sp.]|uniref:GGDEF domain-containing protein n=1 Tax=Sulfuricurvum sp. TaxID=2025608 RepID=UPI002E2F5D05|nr:GGDEF domain-containing protein [Sulfuricurvum sp.]HEX5330866.1 GGDEF domain-containing protein [Sulfuricurvum sp.]
MYHPLVPINRLIRFESYEEYYAQRIYKNFLLFSYIGVVLSLIYIPFDYQIHAPKGEFFYVLGGRLTTAFFAVMVVVAVAFSYFRNHRVEAITIFGTMGFSATVVTYLLYGNSYFFAALAWMFYLVPTIMLAPLLSKRIYLIMEAYQIAFVAFMMSWIGSSADDLFIYLFFAIPLAGYVFILVILNHRISMEAYINAYQNYVLMSLDSLSNLLNRRTWYEESHRHWEHSKGISFMMLDIDYFKRVNDTYGHECGDRVIETVARILLEQTRDYDIVGRLGGEEFGIVLPQTDLHEAQAIAERIRHTIETTPINYEDHIIHVTASIGVIENSEHIDKFATLVNQGDKHLYTAKEQGRNRVISG